MATRVRITDKEEIKELRKRLDECEKEKEELRKQIALLPNSKFDLTNREKSIINFITNNPGKSKQDIISQITLESKGSRNTIFKDITKLEKEYNMIISKRDKPNSQFYRIYINKDSILLDTYDSINNFKKVFYETIDKLVNDTNWSNIDARDQLRNYSYIAALILIYVHILNSYITYLTLEWSHKYIDNPSLLNKLYSLIFFNFMEINLKLVRTFQIRFVKPTVEKCTSVDFFSPLTQGFIYNQFLLKPHIILNILREYKTKNLHLHIFPLIDNAWKISLPIYKYTSMMGPTYNEVKFKPIKQSYNIDNELPLLLFHYIEDHSNSIKRMRVPFRIPLITSIPQIFDIPLEKNDDEILKPILVDIFGQEIYNEIERKYFINRLIWFEFVEDITRLREAIIEEMKENPKSQEWKIYLKFNKIVEKFIGEISKNEYVSKMLKITTKLRDSKLNDSITLRDTIKKIKELKSFFKGNYTL